MGRPDAKDIGEQKQRKHRHQTRAVFLKKRKSDKGDMIVRADGTRYGGQLRRPARADTVAAMHDYVLEKTNKGEVGVGRAESGYGSCQRPAAAVPAMVMC